ncbi:DUF3015 family protein [Nitrospira sp. NS4]|uniref:DUF3015 family protein n=1 Tax=Nitrospira sp. NS4 TaxID=3414498 RepID=UPI003C2D4224
MNTSGARVSLTLFVLLGSILFLSACTVTDTVKDILSSTTPGDWYHDGLLKEEYKALAFATMNRENLLQDMARGRGEYLESMGTLLGVPPSRKQDFFGRAQRHMGEFTLSEPPKPGEIVTALRSDLSAVLQADLEGVHAR